MTRPPCCRRVEGKPAATLFKPAGIPTREIDVIAMTLDEFEAVRLADLEGLYQEIAAGKMGVSRSTFSRIVDSAHRKIAEAIVNGKALRIGGGPVFQRAWRRCEACSSEWEGPTECPRCKGNGNATAVQEQQQGRCGRRRRSGHGKTGGHRPDKGEEK